MDTLPGPEADEFDGLMTRIRRCTLCRDQLPLGPRPVLRAAPSARLLIVGQAPGTRVHASGVPWDDPSGDRLREWLEMPPAVFYDESRVAIVPMGFCYPGRGKSGDLPPLPVCAPTWHPPLLEGLANLQLILLVGQYAQRYYLDSPRGSVTERVRGFESVGPRFFPLPHPSPRNNLWLRRNPWFERDIIPALRRRVAAALEGKMPSRAAASED